MFIRNKFAYKLDIFLSIDILLIVYTVINFDFVGEFSLVFEIERHYLV